MTSTNKHSYGQGQRSAVVRVVGRGRQSEVVLDDKLPFSELEEGLRSYLARNPRWFEGARVTLNVGRRVLSIKQVNHIKQILEGEFKLTIVGLWCGPESLETLVSEKVALPVGLASQQEKHGVLGEMDWQETLLVRGTCRSGTTIHTSGNLVVLGDVNPGAELTADGDIAVFGRLLGLAHAGVNGNIRAFIVALPINAPQIRIGPYIRIESVDGEMRVDRRTRGLVSLARVERGEIVMEPFSPRAIRRRKD